MLNAEIQRRRLADFKAQTINARFMTKEKYQRLVENIRTDGRLTSVPLVYEPPGHEGEIMSGHHRISAALEAMGEDYEDNVLVVLDEQSRDEILARQISHNALAGEDDLATLKEMYQEFEDVDWREYAGIDDKTLDLMEKVDVSALGEANLDFATLQLVFLPEELARARTALEEARKLVSSDERWMLASKDYDRTLDALQAAHSAWNVWNVATAFGLILEVFERHSDDLTELWFEDGEAKREKGYAPVENAIGTRLLPIHVAAKVRKAAERLVSQGKLEGGDLWRALELWADQSLGQ